MTLEEIRQVVEGRFASEWAGQTPVHWAGHDFNTEHDGGSEYVHLSYAFGSEAQKTVGAPGANLRRTSGIVALSINVRRDVHPGTARLNYYTDFARPIFVDWQSGALNFRQIAPSAIRFAMTADTIQIPWVTRTLRWGFTVDVFDA